MYNLRIKREDGENNLELGESYTLIDMAIHTEAFLKQADMHFPEEEFKALPGVKDRCFAFVIDSQGQVYALFREDVIYIMSDSGATYAHPQPIE